MTVYFQHVGEHGGTRDFPKTIGTTKAGLVRLQWSDVAPFLNDLVPEERASLSQNLADVAPDGFQVWGIPSGAKSVLQNIRLGDLLLLLESATLGGQFAYAGKILGFPSRECRDLSYHLWGEYKFPLIVFLLGGLTSYTYKEFCDDFGYSDNWNPAGQTYRIVPDRFSVSRYATEDDLISRLIGFVPSLFSSSVIADFTLADLVELDIADEEGRKLLRLHLQLERSSRLVRAFKRNLAEAKCCVCNFDFKKMYGKIGDGFIEAHHVVPLSQLTESRPTTVKELVPVCSNCHRMLHRRVPIVTCDELRDIIGAQYGALAEASTA